MCVCVCVCVHVWLCVCVCVCVCLGGCARSCGFRHQYKTNVTRQNRTPCQLISEIVNAVRYVIHNVRMHYANATGKLGSN